jgi:hypothetical protein
VATETKEKLIRVLQLMQTTDEKTPMNATQIVEKLSTEYELEGVNRKSIYRDIALLQDCGYDIVQTEDKRSGWYMNTHAFADWRIKIMMDAVQQAKCISINEAMQIRENLLNLTSKRGRSRFSHMMMPNSGNVNAKENIGAYVETIEDDPIQFSYPIYTEVVDKLIDAIYEIESKYPEYGLRRYGEILEEHGIKWGQREMESVDVSDMDLQGVLALLMGMVRAERFCDGAIMGMLRSGAVLRWLQRIEKIVGMDVE